MKLYTKTGDEGQTGLIGGTRVAKNDPRLEAYGTVDELNSFIGVICIHPIDDKVISFLHQIQNQLFTIGSHLATDISKVKLHTSAILCDQVVTLIEQEIDRLDFGLPELTNFILPGGSMVGAQCHICRTITRRLERRLFDLNEIQVVDKQILVYVNRLSDYFFVLSRYLTIQAGGKEIYWKK